MVSPNKWRQCVMVYKSGGCKTKISPKSNGRPNKWRQCVMVFKVLERVLESTRVASHVAMFTAARLSFYQEVSTMNISHVLNINHGSSSREKARRIVAGEEEGEKDRKYMLYCIMWSPLVYWLHICHLPTLHPTCCQPGRTYQRIFHQHYEHINIRHTWQAIT